MKTADRPVVAGTRRWRTLADDLEREQLEQRHARLLSVLQELRQRADASAAQGVPAPLRHAIRDFNKQRIVVAQRIHDLH